MGFNSTGFVAFFCAVFCVYWLTARRLRLQNALLLAASYVFYGLWDWRFCSLLAISTGTDFLVGRALGRATESGRRRWWLAVSLTVNLGILGFFKYFDFFADSFAAALSACGLAADWTSLNVVLPVGISFYTFQSLSYTIDVYRRRAAPVRDPVIYALYVSFFPQLVAGPIERASALLPQVAAPRRLNGSRVEGALFLVLWGYFKKLVIADNLAPIADRVFAPDAGPAGAAALAGIVAFTLQIYCDFSGYSDIARGAARLLGFELRLNFRLPYLASGPSDFWRRWHVSLSTWLRDYLYIPLGGNRGGTLQTARNLALTMLLGGLWHGASWTFVAWGAYHGLLLGAERVLEAIGILRRDRLLASRPGRAFARAGTLALVMIGWTLFRAETLPGALVVLGGVFTATDASAWLSWYNILFFGLPLLLVQAAQHRSGDLLVVTHWPPAVRFVVYALMMLWLLVFSSRETTAFIYFQF
jgi:alginate O-acetyltransferase complex protein AlgI